MLTYTSQRVENIKRINRIPANASILKEHRDPVRTTDKYVHIDHLTVIESLNRRGWAVESYSQIKPHRADREAYVRWMAVYRNPNITLAKAEYDPSILLSDCVPTIIHQGSHDGSKPLTITFALKRLGSSTLCVVGDLTYSEFVYKHFGTVPTPPQLDFELELALAGADPIIRDVARMKSVILRDDVLESFIEQCIEARFNTEIYEVDSTQLIDKSATNLWEQFNFIQDMLVQSRNLRVRLLCKDKSRKAKSVNNIEVSFKLRKKLWNLAIEHLSLAELEKEMLLTL